MCVMGAERLLTGGAKIIPDSAGAGLANKGAGSGSPRADCLCLEGRAWGQRGHSAQHLPVCDVEKAFRACLLTSR